MGDQKGVGEKVLKTPKLEIKMLLGSCLKRKVKRSIGDHKENEEEGQAKVKPSLCLGQSVRGRTVAIFLVHLLNGQKLAVQGASVGDEQAVKMSFDGHGLEVRKYKFISATKKIGNNKIVTKRLLLNYRLLKF